jgi:hypothetical protein
MKIPLALLLIALGLGACTPRYIKPPFNDDEMTRFILGLPPGPPLTIEQIRALVDAPITEEDLIRLEDNNRWSK